MGRWAGRWWASMYEGRLVGMQVDWHARIFIASFELAAGQLQKLVIIIII